MKLRIETGYSETDDISAVPGESVRFVAEDGLTMFEVSSGSDGRSIEVRGVSTTKVGGQFYVPSLELMPQASNLITIRTRPFNSQY